MPANAAAPSDSGKLVIRMASGTTKHDGCPLSRA